ncbi:DNA replication complex GINS protein PSF3 [Histomonas meleagridis]|uniref:DNA replication complex GINS protein PSF3 n=1 Tax=Histomonas meleagridis TaxID=135588 RepID=UPI00355AC7A6|nr:DNA replication complex GINS protein PSF3 [Histomonas meleagridis]KAH0804962.1 DNA replication complex GINS protein PSF3 [Histomonas meleagridis]
MTSSEISDFLHGEELVPVVFLQECEGLGFIVNPEQSDADIPVNYRANIPFWLAQILANPQVNIVRVGVPEWVAGIHPGAAIETERSYHFAAAISSLCGEPEIGKNIIDTCKERLGTVVRNSYISSQSTLQRNEDIVYMTEEKELITQTQKSVDLFYKWKTGQGSMN